MLTTFANSRNAGEMFSTFLKLAIMGILMLHHFGQLAEGHEVPRGGRRDYCKMDEDCDNSRFLYCTGDGGTCDCQKNKGRLWIPQENACMIIEDAPCGRSSDEPKCITNSSCVSEKCVCDDQFLRNGYGMCELGFESLCSEHEKCAGRYLLECVKKNGPNSVSVCKCMEGFVWDEEKRKCVSFAGGRCELPNGKDDQLECIKYSECIKEGPIGSGICKCQEGFVQTDDGTCKVPYNGTCNPTIGLECNHDQFLHCQGGKCACTYYGQVKYDELAQQCRVMAGESCRVKNETEYYSNLQTSKEDVMYRCVSDAKCVPKYRRSRAGTCTCNPGTDRKSDGSCSRYNKGYGQPCSTSIDCNKDMFLECIQDEERGSFCGCPPHEMFYDGSQCRVLVGKSCLLNSNCEELSYCEGKWCVCKQGHRVGPTGGCIPEKKNFSINSPSTDFLAQGQKISRVEYATGNEKAVNECEKFDQNSLDFRRCHCHRSSESFAWFEETHKCLALVGISCTADSDCIPNAICHLHVHEKTCQCGSVAHTTKERLCVRSTDSKHSEANSFRECPNSHSFQPRSSKAVSFTTGDMAKCNIRFYSFIFLFIVHIRRVCHDLFIK